jgi:drug/metabolite transporter (DMT)-like permease
VDASLAFALGAMAMFGLGDVVYKRAALAGIPAHRFMMTQTWFFGPTVLAVGLVTGTLHWHAAVLWAPVAAVFAFGGFYNFARSLASGSVSVNAPIFRMSFVVTAGLAIALLGEPLTAPKALGIVLALAAVWLLVGGGGTGLRAASSGSLARVGFATVSVGVANLIYKVAVAQGAPLSSLLAVQAVFVSSMAMIMTARRDGHIRPDAITWRYAAVTGLVLGAAFSLMLASLARGEASVMVPIAQMGFVVTAIIGFTLLRERFTGRTAVGLALAVAALASLATS